MSKRERGDLGFDVMAATVALHREAITLGAVPAGDPRGTDAGLTASAHLHSVGSGSRCEQNPCRVAAVCLALSELIQYRTEVELGQPVLGVAKLTVEVKKWLETTGDAYAGALGVLMPYGGPRRIFESAGPLPSPLHRNLLCEKPARIRYLLGALRRVVEPYEGELLGLVESPESAQPAGRKPRALLLTAVWQHLKWGEFTYEQVFALVPSIPKPSNVKDAVRKRVKGPDARSLMPRELHPEVLRAARVGKTRRRRSST